MTVAVRQVTRGANVPHEINVVIEIPAYSEPVKYEMDKTTGALFVRRFMSTPMRYPCNYGYLPHTLSADGDPLDVLVVTPYPVISGAVLPARPIGMLRMTDESGDDAKILALPTAKLFAGYRHIVSYTDMPAHLLAQIAYFFEHYKDLDEGKWARVEGWVGIEAAQAEIVTAIRLFDEAPEKPLF